MITVILSLLIICILLLSYAGYLSYKSNSNFRGDGFGDRVLVQKIIDLFLPKEKSLKRLILEDYLFVVDSYTKARDFYFIKILSCMAGILISTAILGTNLITRYNNVFKVSMSVPIEISRQDYNYLSKNLEFPKYNKEKNGFSISGIKDMMNGTSKNSAKVEVIDEKTEELNERNKGIIEGRISSMSGESLEKFKSLDKDTVYKYIQILHNDIHKIFGFLDVMLFMLIPFLAWILPSELLKFYYRYLESNTILEFDDLETYIYINSEKHVIDILDILIEHSSYYKEMFIEFKTIYEENQSDSYTLIAERPEFPFRFKSLVSYLNLMDSSVPTQVLAAIEANKTTTHDDIMRLLYREDNKKKKRLLRLATAAFILSIVRLLLSLVLSAV
jgi:hypothetical protein